MLSVGPARHDPQRVAREIVGYSYLTVAVSLVLWPLATGRPVQSQSVVVLEDIAELTPPGGEAVLIAAAGLGTAAGIPPGKRDPGGLSPQEEQALLQQDCRPVTLGPRVLRAETAPLAHPEYYQYDFDIPAIAEVWRRGSVITSWLLDLTAEFLAQDATLESTAPFVADSGEGRWTAIESIELGVPTPVMTLSLMERFSSQGKGDFTNRLLARMRQAFGGHAVQTK